MSLTKKRLISFALIGETLVNEAQCCLQWYSGGQRTAMIPELSHSKAKFICKLAKERGLI